VGCDSDEMRQMVAEPGPDEPVGSSRGLAGWQRRRRRPI